jgi:hypothetical protein
MPEPTEEPIDDNAMEQWFRFYKRECCLGVLQAHLNAAPKVRRNPFKCGATIAKLTQVNT